VFLSLQFDDLAIYGLDLSLLSSALLRGQPGQLASHHAAAARLARCDELQPLGAQHSPNWPWATQVDTRLRMSNLYLALNCRRRALGSTSTSQNDIRLCLGHRATSLLALYSNFQGGHCLIMLAHEGRVEVEFPSKSCSLNACADAITEQGAVRHTTAARRLARNMSRSLERRMMSWRKSKRGLHACMSLGKLPLMPASSSPPKGIGEDDVVAFSIADLGQLETQAVFGIDLRAISPLQQQVHLAKEVGQPAWLPHQEAPLLDRAPVGDGLALLFQVVSGLRENPPVPPGWVQYGFAQPWIGHRHHEPDDRSWRVKLAVLSSGIAHLAQHGFVEVAEGE